MRTAQTTGVALAALGLLLGGCAHAPGGASSRGSMLKDVVFTEYTPLSRTAEVLRRILSPLAFEQGQQVIAARGEALREQPIDLAQERFAVYVPAGEPPPGGYGLLVFVAPWPQATEPKRWRPPLDRHGLILVSAANSGNDSKVYERRLPLALLAYHNVRARYPVDPERVYVGGLSGGSRVAEAAALAYPDVFRGALLNAGSEPIGGGRGIRLPPKDLFQQFQQSRLVYVTGAQDEQTVMDDEVSLASMRSWCVFDLAVEAPPQLGHQALDALALDRALDALEQRSAVDAGKRARCNADLQRAMAAKLAEVGAARARGDREAARTKLREIDAFYGGLAGAEVLALEAQLAAAP